MRVTAALLLLLPAAAPAQPLAQLYTEPQPPAASALERLNLMRHWGTGLPTNGRRDGIARIQVVGGQVLAQTRGGELVVLNAETGAVVWQSLLGAAYPYGLRIGVNDRSYFAFAGTRLYELDKASGRTLAAFDLPSSPATGPVADESFLFVCTGSNRLIGYALARPAPGPTDSPNAPRASLVAANPIRDVPPPPTNLRRETPLPRAEIVTESLRVGGPRLGDNSALRQRAPSMTTLASAVPPYTLTMGGAAPSVTVMPSAVPPYSLTKGGATPSVSVVRALTDLNPVFSLGPQPTQVWEIVTADRLDQAPLLAGRYLLTATAGRTVAGYFRDTGRPTFTFEPSSPVTAPLGQYESVAYVPTLDGTVSALTIDTGRLLWRYVAGSTVTQRPLVTDADVFLSTLRAGVERVDRASGLGVWRARDAGRVVAANVKFVYALDPDGVLLVLDRQSGARLASLDVRGYTVPVTNFQNDRIILAAEDGSLLCLRDRNLPRPEAGRNERTTIGRDEQNLMKPTDKPVTPPAPKPAPPKPGKPADEKKEDMKDN